MPYTPLPTPPWGFQLFHVGYSALIQRQIVWYPQGKDDPYWTVVGETTEPNVGSICATLLTSDFEFDPDMETVEDCTGPGYVSGSDYWNKPVFGVTHGNLNMGFPNEVKNNGVVFKSANFAAWENQDPLYWSWTADPRKAGKFAFMRNGHIVTNDTDNDGSQQGGLVKNRTSEYDASTGTTLLKAGPFGWFGTQTNSNIGVDPTLPVSTDGGKPSGSPTNNYPDGTGHKLYQAALVDVPDIKYLLLYVRNTMLFSNGQSYWSPTGDQGYGYRNSIPIAVMDLGYTNPKFIEGESSEADRYRFTGDLNLYFKDSVMMRVPGRVT